MDYAIAIAITTGGFAIGGYIMGRLAAMYEIDFLKHSLALKKKQSSDLASRVYSLEARLKDAGKNDYRDEKGRFARKVA